MIAEGPNTAAPEEEETTETSAPPVDVRALSKRLGRYQLVLPLAQGGMGLVFAGRLVGAHGVERLVAIKTLRPITSANDRAALLREARLTSRLHHRNIVATLDLGEVDDVPYVVMELVDGVPLSRLLMALANKGQRLPAPLAAWIVMQAAIGLHAAHELTDATGQPLGLVHRDVSPQNILLSMSGEVKLADFGIAKFAGRDESTATGMIKGKFAYMSPEQASAIELDRRSDIFALGIILWELLCHERLFAGETPAKTILRVMEHTPKSPVEIAPEVGAELSRIAMRCLEKDPGRRFSTAAEVADELRAVLRASGAGVDEADLATLVATHFGAERRAAMDRLKTSKGLDEVPASALDAADASAIAMSLGTPARGLTIPTEGSRLRVAGVVALLAIVGGLVGWQIFARSTTAPVTAGTELPATAPSSAAASPTAAPAPSAPPAPTAAPTQSDTGPVATGAIAPSSGPPIKTRPPIKTTKARPTKTGASPPAPSKPEVTPEPTGGKPFESL